jgi:membrane-associated phospholipid phosphatase
MSEVHRARRPWFGPLTAVLLVAIAGNAHAQIRQRPRRFDASTVGPPRRDSTLQTHPAYRASVWDVASVGTAGGLFLLPKALGLPRGTPSCAPCDPSTLPSVDRWAAFRGWQPANVGSSIALAAVAGAGGYLVLNDVSSNLAVANAAVLANAASWTLASAQWLKVVVRRKRPVLYTAAAAAAAGSRESQESLPSGHTSAAFAVATAYLVIAGREHLPHRPRNTILLYAGAIGVAALRVAAGKHFPTDILAGAALGSGIGWLTPTLHW